MLELDHALNGGIQNPSDMRNPISNPEKLRACFTRERRQQWRDRNATRGARLSAAMIVGLVSRGLATMAQEKMKAGDKLVEVARVRITDAGHVALAADG
jgi:hypothetical protein